MIKSVNAASDFEPAAELQKCRERTLDSQGLPWKHLLSFLVLSFFLFFIPPFWAFLFVTLALKKELKETLWFGLILSFWAAFCLIYTTPVWDTISHYWMWKYITVFDVRPDVSEFFFGVDWYRWLKIFVIDILGTETYIWFVLLVYFLILFALYTFTRKQVGNDCLKCWLALAAVAGFFPLWGYSRNSLAIVLCFLPILLPKWSLAFTLLCFWIAYNFHDSILLLFPAVILCLVLKYKIVRVTVFTYSAFLSLAFALLLRFPRLIYRISSGAIDEERIDNYMEVSDMFSTGSDYIYITLSFGWIIFMLYFILKHEKQITDHYLHALFTISSGIYLAGFVLGLYTLRIRFEYITLWSGMLLLYPLAKESLTKEKLRLFNVALTISFTGYLILALKPSFYDVGKYFPDVELCRNIFWRMFYYPAVLLLDVNSYGFGNNVFETSLWGGI